MGIFSDCLMLSDIDGTLLCNGKIPARNLEWIEHFKSEGGIFTVATGRAALAAEYSYRLAHANAPVVCCNGSMIYDFETSKILYAANLPEECKIVLPQIMQAFPNIGVEVHSGTKIYALRTTKRVLEHQRYENLIFEEPPFNTDEITWNKLLMTVDNTQELKELEVFCQQFQCSRFLTTGCSSKAIFFEVLPHGIDKGSALNQLKKLTNAKYTLAIGDFYNDFQMITAANFGATTAAAPDDIKSVAKFVTGPCENGAVADFIIEAEKQIKSGNFATQTERK